MDEGVDLPGDECRFQIIYKIPYPDLGSKQVRARLSLDSEWYDYKTSLRLVQTHGRECDLKRITAKHILLTID